MTKSIDHDDEPKHKHEHGPKEDERQRRPRREREDSGDDPKRHATIIERRWQGSPPPTAHRGAVRKGAPAVAEAARRCIAAGDGRNPSASFTSFSPSIDNAVWTNMFERTGKIIAKVTISSDHLVSVCIRA